MLRVAFDLEHERQSSAGITRYAASLAVALSELADVELIPIGGGQPVRRGTLGKRLLTARQDFWWYPFAGRREARRSNADVYHCPAPRAPVTAGTPPFAVTIHDLASVHFPETLTPWSRAYERALLPRIARAAARVIVPSSDTASDVETILRLPAAKIRIIPLGVDAAFFEQEHTKAPFDFPYVLFVGTPQPRKNLSRLADAVRRLSDRGSELRLVVAGSDGWGSTVPNAAQITFTGRVTDQQLRTLYKHSACVALVSVHEGFGLPVLEAMAVGTPVVASNVAALPETAGGAAVMVDPLDVASIADGIEAAIARRDVLVPAGRALAARRSWKEAARLTLDVYREIA